MAKFPETINLAVVNTRPVSIFKDVAKTQLDYKAKFLQFMFSDGDVCAILQTEDGSIRVRDVYFVRFDDVNGGKDEN